MGVLAGERVNIFLGWFKGKVEMTLSDVLVLIPARGGSKGIPRKNIRSFAGHPLVAYSIAAGLQAETVTRVIVSTDDEQIAAVARSYGAETPFQRPVELAADHTTDLPVFQHALKWLAEQEHYHPEVVVHLHATTPVRPPGCLDQAIRLLQAHAEAEAVRSVVTPLQTPYKMWRIDDQTGRMRPLLAIPGIPEPYNTPRQSLPAVYLQTGHVNAIRPATILAGSMTGQFILPQIIDARYELDMDTPEDWEYGEWMVGKGNLEMIRPEVKK
jgi:CMP-N-acetylneuraminic acid synthetase